MSPGTWIADCISLDCSRACDALRLRASCLKVGPSTTNHHQICPSSRDSCRSEYRHPFDHLSVNPYATLHDTVEISVLGHQAAVPPMR